MKLKEFFYRLGLKPKPRRYPFKICEQRVQGHTIKYAQWLHPRAQNSYNCKIREEEVRKLQEFLRPGDVAVDIGAHTGDTSLPMAVCVGPTGCVLAFEPNPYVFETLRANADLNRETMNIQAYRLAVTEEDRNYEFSYCDPGFVNGGAVEKTQHLRRGAAYRQTVEGVRLVDFVEKHHPELGARIKYIKVDTEGYDLYVLKSIASLIERVRPIIRAEVLKGTDPAYRFELYDFLAAKQYALYLNHRDAHSQPMTRDEMLAHVHYDVFCVPN